MSPKPIRAKQPRSPRRRLPHAALLIIGIGLAAIVAYYTWPSRAAIFCDRMPELGALAACAAVLLVVCFRAIATAHVVGEDRRIAGSALVLACLALFLSVHFLAQYHKPCKEVQQMRQGMLH